MSHDTVALPLAPGHWAVDRTHSTVEFSVRHLGISKVRGAFGVFDAEVIVGETLADSSLTATVQLSSVHTNNSLRDAHLRNTDFFNVDTNPVMTFVSRTIAAGAGDTLIVTGDLTLNGVTRTQRLDVDFLGAAILPLDGSSHAGFAAVGTLSRGEFGIDFNAPMAGGVVIGDQVEIVLDIQLMPAHEAIPYHAKFLPAV